MGRRGTYGTQAPSHGPTLRTVHVNQILRPRENVRGHHPAVGGVRLLAAPEGVRAVVLLNWLHTDAAGWRAAL